jgi:hypothetical protein
MKPEPAIRRYITPPTDPILKTSLDTKLSEYEMRIKGKGKPWENMHPEAAHNTYPGFRDAYYKAYVMKAVINAKGQPVDAWKLSADLVAEHGITFNVDDFNNACGVVCCYCGNIPKEELQGGTGLRAATVQ